MNYCKVFSPALHFNASTHFLYQIKHIWNRTSDNWFKNKWTEKKKNTRGRLRSKDPKKQFFENKIKNKTTLNVAVKWHWKHAVNQLHLLQTDSKGKQLYTLWMVLLCSFPLTIWEAENRFNCNKVICLLRHILSWPWRVTLSLWRKCCISKGCDVFSELWAAQMLPQAPQDAVTASPSLHDT